MKPKKYFWGEGLFKEDENGMHLLGAKCRKCGKISFPKTDICHDCLSEELDEVPLSQKGILHSWTITRVPVGKFPCPHPLGVISLPDDKVRVTAPLVAQDSYEIGKPVQIESAMLWEEDDCEVWGYKFRQLEE
jgi:uncharacterized OB-fold protein